jgi:hypothetical protein
MIPEEIAQRFPLPSSLRSHEDVAYDIERIRDGFIDAAMILYQKTKPSREQSLALTRLEEAYLWAQEAITRHFHTN